jgi:hypothetical protein
MRRRTPRCLARFSAIPWFAALVTTALPDAVSTLPAGRRSAEVVSATVHFQTEYQAIHLAAWLPLKTKWYESQW